MSRPEILTAITSCGHSIDHNEVVLKFDPKQPGHNALNQLCNRVETAVAEQRGYDLAKADALIAKLTEALERIERWFGEFPETGKTWPDGTAMSYGACNGSNGERDFMRSIAREALSAVSGLSRAETAYQEEARV